MVQQISDSYNENGGFNENDRNLEKVTQALSRHFKKEYENTPTNKFLNLIRDIKTIKKDWNG